MKKNIYEIHVKEGFSDKRGIKRLSNIIQIDSLNDRTRNKIYSATMELVNKTDDKRKFVEYIYEDIFSLTKNDIPLNGQEFDIFSDYYKNVEDEILFNLRNCEYNNVFDFIIGIIRGIKINKLKNWYIKEIEKIFKEENVNYKIVGDNIIDIIDEYQVAEIEETLKNPYDIVRKHYNKAIEKLYQDRDYDNSIKESISSVEAMCQALTENNKAILGDTLKLLKDKIHPAMKSAFEKLYGYTSDANGIRHANGLGEGNSTYAEAKYMLISCSAFVNYLKENYEKENKNE